MLPYAIGEIWLIPLKRDICTHCTQIDFFAGHAPKIICLYKRKNYMKLHI